MPPRLSDIRATFDRLGELPAGPEHDQAVEELRATLRALPASDVGQLFMDVQRAAVARGGSSGIDGADQLTAAGPAALNSLPGMGTDQAA